MKIDGYVLLHTFLTRSLPNFSSNEFMVSAESQTQMESVRITEQFSENPHEMDIDKVVIFDRNNATRQCRWI